jgi:hypothetical protein
MIVVVAEGHGIAQVAGAALIDTALCWTGGADSRYAMVMNVSIESLRVRLQRNLGWLSLVLLPVVMIWPVAFGLSQDPMGLGLGLLTGGYPGWLPGTTNLDLNVGATTQALGHLAAEQWLSGEVPWWNPYNGLGMPLAGEMQASALFLPFVLLLHFQNGPLLIKIALQMVAGPATYALLRRLGLGVSLSWIGGLMFALNGTYAWLGHAPMMPIAFLPLFLIGIENARSGGFRLLALALALSVYAGFPETAYLDGLLALVWAIWRWRQSDQKARFVRCVALGGALGLVLAGPAIWSFLHMLIHGSVQNHAILSFASPSEPAPTQIYAVWLFPYLFGPLQAFTPADADGELGGLLANLGGYLGMAPLLLVLVAVSGTWLRGLRLLLAVWIALCLIRTASVPSVVQAINMIPMIRETIISRYGIAPWQFASVLLGVLALADWQAGTVSRRRVWAAATSCLVIAFGALWLAFPLLRRMSESEPKFSFWPILSVLWGVLVAGAVTCLLTRPARPYRMAAMLGILTVNAAAMFCLPMLSGPRGISIDRAAISFLKDHIGLQRFYTLGPYRPNYGAYFETAQLTHEYLPLPSLWGSYIQTALDPSAHLIMFRGNYPPTPPGQPTHADEFIAHLANFKALGVRYVLTEPGANPFVSLSGNPPPAPDAAPRNIGSGRSISGGAAPGLVPPLRVYQDSVMDIYELADAAPYFEAPDGACRLHPVDRRLLTADCDQPSTLVRRELFFSGWRARVNGSPAEITPYRDVMQQIALQAGETTIRFSYAPPLSRSLWVLAGLAALALLPWHRLHRRSPRDSPA